ncbi:hypothetical protein [Streptomyces sp. ISL-86]|uniref:hypothetical protein n=1 Tax=Streptomyces sp. ISL-86 TaxID=2819187 RepID=UPI001BEBBD23|nr:hypothetical protein [Streptomyces sp. ISL-86]MBT2453309.1 hypothetical protein [Streptomyces sp. ISL-86]
MTEDLTKWPRLLVTGAPVTEEQADDILIRTANLYLLDGNDKAWTASVYHALGLEPGQYANATIDSIRAVTKELDVLPLTLLYTSRIASTWIGGPHGWCNWDGTIGSSNYNVGKWPDREAVLSDWDTIAVAFPYLELTAQLLADEGADAAPVLGQWRITGGRATEETPGQRITPPVELTEIDMFTRLFGTGGERGVTERRLTAAVERVRAARAALR